MRRDAHSISSGHRRATAFPQIAAFSQSGCKPGAFSPFRDEATTKWLHFASVRDQDGRGRRAGSLAGMEILVTGASGFVGSELIPRLQRDGPAVRAFARDAARVALPVPVHVGDAVTGAGLEPALDGVEAAYFLIHSMEPTPAGNGSFADRDRLAAERFAAAARSAGVERVVYLGGFVPADAPASRHLASRLEVEE